MSGFFQKSDQLRYRRATTPRYRDIRDRSTLELLDLLFYEINNPQPGQEIDTFSNESSEDGDYTVWIMRCGPKNQLGEIEYFVPGRPLLKIAFVTYVLKRTNVVGKFSVREDVRLVLGDNEQILVANSLFFQDFVSEQPGVTTNPQVLFVVIHATGSWTGATNLIINYEPDGALRTVRIVRALN